MDKTDLKEIIEANSNLPDKIRKEGWDVKYNKNSDMIIMGAKFPTNSYYFNVGGTGVLIRIDDKKQIYGFAIENFKYFAARNPEFKPFYYLVAHPFKAYVFYMIAKGLNKMKVIGVVSQYVAGQAAYIR